MDRRWTGLLIVVVVVLGAAALPAVVGKRIAGVATSAPVPGPPRVGDCLTLPEDGGADPYAGSGYAARSVQPCAGVRFGEVVATIRDRRPTAPAAPTIAPPTDGSALNTDPNQSACVDAVWRYLGVPLAADHSPVLATYWAPLGFLGVAPSGPTARQRAAGQKWVACLLFVNDEHGSSVWYPGTARNSFATGTAPGAFAVCLGSADISTEQPTSCDRPHRVEVFGTTSTARPGLTGELLDRSCRTLVAAMTRASDATAGGRLEVRAVAVHEGVAGLAAGLGSADDISGVAACLVIAPAPRLLGAALLGLGDKPIPWAR